MRIVLFLALTACSIPGKTLVTGDGGDDGSTVDAPPSGTFRWIRSLSSMAVTGISMGTSGNVAVAGYISTPADVGGGLLTPVGGVDMVVASFAEADGAHVYSIRHGGVGQEFGFLDVVDATGSPILYGLTGGTPYDLGQGSTASSGQSDGFIGRYGSGAPAWLHRLHGVLDEKFINSAKGAGSTVYGVGWFEGTATATWQTQGLAALAGRDIFMARFNTFTGASDLTKTFGTKNREEASGAAFDKDGGLIIGGMFDNVIEPTDNLKFGGLAKPLSSAGSLDIYVAKLAANGDGVWAVSLGGVEEDRDPRIATDANGDIYITASFRAEWLAGTTKLKANGGFDVFVAKLNGTNGDVIWAKSFGGSGDDGERGISVDNRGNVVVTGWAVGSLDGEPTLGGADAVVACYDAANGAQKWRKVFSTAGDDRAWSTGFGSSGDVLAVVNLGGAYDFGFPVTGPATPSSVLMRIVP